jgi:PAS domain S-box-containing protein
MSRLLKFLFLLLLFKLTLFAELNFSQEEKEYIKNNKIKVAMLPDFPPFSILKNGEIEGFSYDILQLISEKSSLNFEYEVNKWPVNLKKFKEKKIDIIDAISYRDSRLSFTNYTKPYFEIPLMIFSRKDLTDYTDLNSLKNMKLGMTKNIFYKNLIEDLNLFEIVEYESFEKKLDALAFGEVDIIFGHLLSTQNAIKNKQYTNMKVLDELNLPNLKKTDLRFGITKENKILYGIMKKSFDSISKIEWSNLRKKWIDTYGLEKEKANIIEELEAKERLFLVEKKIKCITTNWHPFIFVNDKPHGISVDFWNIIKEKALIDSSCEVVDSYEKIEEKIKNKEADLTLAAVVTEDKVSYSRFSIPYMSYPLAIATKLDKRYITNTSILDGKKVGIVKDTGIYKILIEKYPQIKFTSYKNNFDALKGLSNNEVFAIIDILPELSHYIRKYGFNDIKISGTTEFNLDFRIMIREDYDLLVSIVNKAIKSISIAKIQELKNKWMSVKYENFVDYTKFWQIAIVILIILIIMIYRQIVLNTHNKKLQEANRNIELKSKELEEKTLELHSQKILFEKTFNDSSDGVFLATFDGKTKIVKCNPKSYQLLGFESEEEFINTNRENILPPFQPDGSNSLELIDKYLHKTIEEGSCTFEMLHKKKDGTLIWLDVVITAIEFQDKKLIHIVWRDIQKRKDIEDELNSLTIKLEEKVQSEIAKNEEKTKQLIQQSRLAQMGEMLSMIAHQWRQPLTAISATTNNILIRLMLDEKLPKQNLEKELSLISDYSIHLSTTIDDFRNFFKSDKEKILICLENIINNSVSIIKGSLESNNIKLEIELDSNEEVMVHATEINQVILNIIKNAEDVLVENLVLDSKIKIRTYSDEQNVYIEISDNGNGIDEEIIEKIFDPYFSTKSEKEGTGLGLYMSKIIINDHCGGSLTVKNGTEGAVFTIQLSKNI